MDYAPIIIFGYDRPTHMQEMLTSLFKNEEVQSSEAYIYIDGSKSTTNEENHQKVIDLVSERLPFLKTNLILRKENYGCKKNIISGINEVLSKNDRAIILEDDLILGKNFLNYMNQSLNRYKENKKVWHINGYSYPQIFRNKEKASISVLAQPWGWGTWDDRWNIFYEGKYYEKNVISTLNQEKRKKYNFYNLATYWEDALKLDQVNKNSIWDAYWYQAIFLNDGLTIFPQVSHVQNSGFDGSGLHCGQNNQFDTKLNSFKTTKFPSSIKESNLYRLNAYLFFKKYKILDYINYHQKKISSIKNFSSWILKKR